MTTQTERRKEKRNRPPSLVYVELASANGGMMRDVSLDGCAVRVMMPLQAGQNTPFAFSIDDSTRIEGHGRVLWVEEDGKVAGLEFTQVTPQLREQVRRWIAGESKPVSAAPAAEPIHSPQPTMQELREEIRAVVQQAEPPPVKPRAPLSTSEPSAEVVQMEEVVEEIKSGPVLPVEPPRADSSTPILPAFQLPRAQESVPAPQEERRPPWRLAQAAKEVDEAKEEIAAPPVAQEVEPLLPLEALEPLGPLEPLEPLASPESAEVASEVPARASWVDRVSVPLVAGILLFLTLVAGAIVFHRPLGYGLIRLGETIAGKEEALVPEPQKNAPVTEPAQNTGTSAGNVETPLTPPANTPASQTKPAESEPEKKDVAPPATPTEIAPAGNPNANQFARVAPPTPPNVEAGQQEFQQAQQILKNRGKVAELPEAVRLLWIAVEKGNAGAEIALAELYRTGRGVAKSCDQTRILLTAAARKGSEEAQRSLQQFEQEGCEE